MTTRSSKSPLMQGKHILVVEDEAPIRDMVRFALERKGLTVTEAADVQDARLSIAGRRPDLILNSGNNKKDHGECRRPEYERILVKSIKIC